MALAIINQFLESYFNSKTYHDSIKEQNLADKVINYLPGRSIVESPLEFLEVYRGNRQTLDLGKYGVMNHYVINSFSNLILDTEDQESEKFKSVALLAHSLVHFKDPNKCFTVDGVLDLIFHNVLYGVNDVEDFFVEIYKHLLLESSAIIYKDPRTEVKVKIAESLFKIFLLQRDNNNTTDSVNELETLISKHLEIENSYRNTSSYYPILTFYVIYNEESKRRLQEYLMLIMPSYLKVIEF